MGATLIMAPEAYVQNKKALLYRAGQLVEKDAREVENGLILRVRSIDLTLESAKAII